MLNKKIMAISIVSIFLFGSSFSIGASKVMAGNEQSSLRSSGDREFKNNEYFYPDYPFSPEYKPGELIVKFSDKVTFSESSEGFILTGIESIDKLNIEFGVSSVEKLLEYDEEDLFSRFPEGYMKRETFDQYIEKAKNIVNPS